MHLPWPEVERAQATLQAWVGRRVQVTQSITHEDDRLVFVEHFEKRSGRSTTFQVL